MEVNREHSPVYTGLTVVVVLGVFNKTGRHLLKHKECIRFNNDDIS